ncbi:aspartate kinase [Brumimicrobium aurantiacum]|uniref:Aspartokinase n=1 Tax=Brumimicrobium aurantiacum TaxID=1737063 RepID=A0A3E1EY55_9FLAO|nr:aspartate kinase [Brumimicrobium aurantiacum]RFC54490.1 aspartate kinase [Brumimicrobium aurantiacum]
MKVFKFGGASVKTAKAVRNVKTILSQSGQEQLFVVISAMGKTTNAMEGIVKALYDKNYTIFDRLVKDRKEFHLEIMLDLFEDQNHSIFNEVNDIFENLLALKSQRLVENYNFQYDQIVSLGEILSTKIIAAYLSICDENVAWMDARTFIRTDDHYRQAEVDWVKTQELLDFELASNNARILITQGFLGHTKEGFTTTLGREGSDFTAGIIAYCTNAESVTIWKDVPGMLNADPKWFENTVKLDKISFKEAIELAYYGASVIHPKTIKPLQNKNIPLLIKSFLDPNSEGSIIQDSTEHDDLIPSFIFKINQVLLSITPKDFSFVVEENLSDIIKKLALSGGHINVMQNSAVSFSVCLDIDNFGLNRLVGMLQDEYEVRYNNNLELVTIRHYDQATIDRVTHGREILMEQKTRQTVRIVMRNLE